MGLLVNLFVYCIIFEGVLSKKDVEIEFIKSYVEKQPNSLVVSAFLCWEPGDILSLTQQINKINYMINVKTKEITELNNKNIGSEILYIIDSSCELFEPTLNLANASNSFAVPNHWLIFTPNDFTINIFQSYLVDLNSKVILARKIDETNFDVEYIYKFRRNETLNLDVFAKWNYETGFTSYDATNIWKRRRNVKRHELTTVMAVLNNNTYKHMTDYRFNEIDPSSKLNYVLSFFVADFLNASLKIKYVPTWYKPQSKDQNNTVMGTLKMKQADFSSSPFFCKAERYYMFKCLAMTTPVYGKFIFRNPPLAYVKNIFVLPFDLRLWITDVSVLFICSIFLYFIILWEWKLLDETGNEPEIDMIRASFADAVLFTIGAVCQQGYATEPKGSSGKILILTIFITLIFLFTAYTAYTVVLFQSTADHIKTLEDLYNSKMTLGSDDKPYFIGPFTNFTEKWRKKIYRERIAPKNGPSNLLELYEGIQRVRKEYFAFHIDQMSGYKAISDTFLEQEKCGLKEIHFIEETNAYTVGPGDNPFYKQLLIAYHRMQEVGLNIRELRRRTANRPECTMQGNNYRSAGILDLYSVYMLLVIGLSFSLLLLFFEILIHKIIQRKYNNEITIYK